MATAMTCSQCWTTVAAGKTHCPRCGAKLTGAPPSFAGLLKSYPWLGVLLALSLFATIWAATRSPKVEPIAPPAEPPVTVAPPPVTEEVSDEPLPPPPMIVPEPAAPEPVEQRAPQQAPAAVRELSPVGEMRENGTWSAGPGAPQPGRD